jgi:DNA-binding NtrC family response regulator
VLACDKSLPGKDGLWLLSELRDKHPDVAVVVASGDDSIPPIFTLQSNVVAYFVKPLDLDGVLGAVHKGVAWHGQRRSA